MSVKVIECIKAMEQTLQGINVLTGKIVFVYDEDDLIKKISGIQFPGVGIIYEGMHSMPSAGASGHIGLSAELVISLVLIDQGESIIVTNQKKVHAVTYLDLIRGSLMATRSPTGHFWRFLVEAPAEVRKGMVYWVQRWSTPVQLPPIK